MSLPLSIVCEIVNGISLDRNGKHINIFDHHPSDFFNNDPFEIIITSIYPDIGKESLLFLIFQLKKRRD